MGLQGIAEPSHVGGNEKGGTDGKESREGKIV